MMLACGLFAAANACAKAVQVISGGAIPPEQVTFCRFAFGLLGLLPWLVRARTSALRTRAPGLHALRVLFGVGGVTCLFAALARMPLGEVTAIAWSSPLVAMLIAALLMGDRVGIGRWLAAGVGFAGVAVMMRPTGAGLAPAGLLALAAALFNGAEVATIRALASRDPPLTVLLISNGAGTVLSLALASPSLTAPSAPELALLAGVGLGTVAGQLLFMEALRLRELSFVAPFYYATLVYAFVYGIVLFGEQPTRHGLLGAAMIVASGLYTLRVKRPT